ncbi:MAG: hypothetical protein AAFR16_08095 [Pseudomonadota bacterium]
MSRETPADPQTPRPAATLLLLRDDADGRVRVLMGRRPSGARFMPNAVVFPGGALDDEDAALAARLAATAPELRPPARCLERLSVEPAPEAGMRVPAAGETLGLALALAAVRETFEETGLRLGTEAGPVASGLDGAGPAWSAFRAAPALPALRFFLRALTPPARPRRFDARFFLAPAAAVLGDPDDFAAADGELSRLGWRTIAEARDGESPFITALALDELETALAGGPAAALFAGPYERPAPFFRHGSRGGAQPIDPA